MVKESSSIMGELLYQIDKRVPRVDNADDKTIAGAASLGWKGRFTEPDGLQIQGWTPHN